MPKGTGIVSQHIDFSKNFEDGLALTENDRAYIYAKIIINKMRITIIHPTRGRKKLAFETATKWRDRADNPENIEYLFSVDNDDIQWAVNMPTYWGGAFTLQKYSILHNNNKSAIEAINNAAKIATGDLLIIVSDDFDCPEHWDTLLRESVKDKSDFLLKTDDGLQPTLVTLPIMDRTYYERFGYVYHPDYLHMFSDQEMTAVAIMTGKYLKSDLKFPHNHYTTGKTPKDAVNIKNDATWGQGEALFNARLKNNFDLPPEQIVKHYSEIVWR